MQPLDQEIANGLAHRQNLTRSRRHARRPLPCSVLVWNGRADRKFRPDRVAGKNVALL
jgi:hypothetical protein